MRAPGIASLLLLAFVGTAVAQDCPRADIVCVPEETTLDLAFRTAPNGATIDVAAGSYPSPGATAFRLGTDKNRSFTVRARGAAGSVTLTGQDTNPVVILDGLGTGRWITFEGLRFVTGRSTTANIAGGVTLKNARASFVDCQFVGNKAGSGSNGGAGLGLYGGARALIVRSLFEDNQALSEGAGIFAQTGAAPYDTPSEVWVYASTFRDNCETASFANCTSGNGAGGAALIRNSRGYFADSLFQDNIAGRVGGAIYALGNFACTGTACPATPATEVVVVRSRFAGNRADGAATITEGGAIHVEDCARARIYHSVFEDNFADWGGGVETFRGALEIYDSILRRNRAIASGATAPQGGAILAISGDTVGCSTGQVRDYPAASLRIERSLIEGGSAAAQEAQTGGCIAAKGDTVNVGSGSCQTSQTARCAQVSITDSALFDCGVARASTPVFVSGGGFVFDRAHAQLTDVLIARNQASGNDGTVCSQGGAGVVSGDARAVLSDVLFSGNTSQCQNDNLRLVSGGTTSESNVRYLTATSASPNDGKLLGLPPQIAVDTPLTQGESWLAHGWSGASATLDGSALGTNPKNGRIATGDALHTLSVAGGAFQDTADVSSAVAPATTLNAAPACAAPSSTLSWSTPAGNFLAAFVDQNVAGTSAGGSTGVTPPGTVTFRRVALTAQGAAFDEITVFVGECQLFADGFESGNTAAWDVTQG